MPKPATKRPHKHGKGVIRKVKQSGRVYDLDVGGLGGFETGEHAKLSEAGRLAFGTPHFSPEAIAEKPDQQNIRLVKDFLAVGKWKVGHTASGEAELFHFTPEVLRQIADNFQIAKNRGWHFNLCYTHGNRETKEVHPRELIAAIDQVVLDGGRLWFSVYVNAEQAAELQRSTAKVSPRIRENWMDGAGNRYDYALNHIAVTDLPVLPGQSPFFQLANEEPNMPTYEELLELLGRTFALFPGNVHLSDDVTEETVATEWKTLLGILEGMNVDDNTETPGEGSQTTTTPVGETTSDMSNGVAGTILAKLNDLSNQFQQFKAGQARDNQSRYKAKLEELKAAGKITPAQALEYQKIGSGVGWDMSILNPLDNNRSLDMSNRSRGNATAKPPKVDGDAELTDEEIAGNLREMGLLPKARK